VSQVVHDCDTTLSKGFSSAVNSGFMHADWILTQVTLPLCASVAAQWYHVSLAGLALRIAKELSTW
jgi:hypothetical protein